MTRGVRPDTLICFTCGQWKQDGAFHRNTSNPARRGYGAKCRRCNTIGPQWPGDEQRPTSMVGISIYTPWPSKLAEPITPDRHDAFPTEWTA